MDQPRPTAPMPPSIDPEDEGTSPQTPEEERQERIEYLRSIAPDRGKKHKSRKGLIILIIILILLLGGAAYWFLGRSTSTPSKKSTNSSTSSPNNSSSSQSGASQIPTTTEHYDSPYLRLGFDHPTGWTVTDNGNGKLTAVSGPLELANPSGQKSTGQITLTVRASGQALPEFDKASAVAALDSQKIAYAKPTATQRGNTYVSFLRYATDTYSDGLDGVYITGDAGYKAGQDIPKTDIAKVDPIVSITFAGCSDAACSAAPAAMAISTSSWQDTSFSGPLMKMLESFSFQ